MKALCAVLVSLILAVSAAAQEAKPAPVSRPADELQVMPLWEQGAPGALGNQPEDQPTLTYYPVAYRGGAGTAVIVLPGGSYRNLASNHEGRQVANWLNAMGVTAFVLKYRLGPKYHHPIELGDAQRSIRMVRSRAGEFGIRADRIGIMGFSAGGHLASTAGTHFDSGKSGAADAIERAGSRPDFLILAYPVISMKEPYTHQGSLKMLLGENPDPALQEALSNELQVTPQTPPTFLFTSSTDTVVPSENSVLFYLALHKAGVPAELHVFEKAPHGVGLDLNDLAVGEWPTLLRNWLESRGLLTK